MSKSLYPMMRSTRNMLAMMSVAFLAHSQAGQPPVLSSIGPQKVSPGGTLGPLPFLASSPVLPGSALSISGTSSDQSLVRNSDIVFSPGFGEFGNHRTVLITAQATTLGGVTTIAVTASDGLTNAITSFPVTVCNFGLRPTTNSNLILILDASVSEPYPSVIDVTNANISITRLKVLLNGFSHTFPSDVGVLLVGPNGQKVVLMNGAGGGHPGITNMQLTFDQIASSSIATNGPLTNGSFTPTDYSGSSRSFLSPAPPGPYTNTLEDFNGISPNGRWALYVQDFEAPDAGSIANGWGLDISIDLAVPPDLKVSEDKDFLKFTLSGGTPNAEFGLQTAKDLTTWTYTGLTTVIGTDGSAQIQIPLSQVPGASFFRMFAR